MTEKQRKLPKKAVKSLIMYCEEKAEEAGGSGSEMFKRYLELMRKYEDYFFGEPWPETLDRGFMSSGREELGFVEGGGSYAEKCERFTVACLREAISLEGFDSKRFEEHAEWLGGVPCWDCVVPYAMSLRKAVEEDEQRKRENEERMRSTEPSWMTEHMHEYDRRPDVVRSDGMRRVELSFYEHAGGAHDKSCEVRNKYRCPYGEESEQLIERGGKAKRVWREIRWYDHHWSPSATCLPAAQEMKWYHYGEPEIIDVTNYDDVLKAIDDGRLQKIMEEHKRYMKETRYEAGAL